MKKAISLLLSLTLALSLLPACRPSAQESSPLVAPSPSAAPSEAVPPLAEPSQPCYQIAYIIWSGRPEVNPDNLEVYDISDTDRISFYIQGAYDIEADQWTDAAILRETGASAAEVAVLRFPDEDAAKRGEERLKAYLHSREGDFTGYAPAQAQLVADAALVREGVYVGLFICEDSDRAAKTFSDALDMELVSPAPESARDVNELMDLMLDYCELTGDDLAHTERVEDADSLKAIIEGDYGLEGHPWEDAAIVRGTDGSVFELAVLRFADDDAAFDALYPIVWYLDAKEEQYARFPAQAKLLSEANAYNPGRTGFVVLTVCSNPAVPMQPCTDYLQPNNGVFSRLRHEKKEPVPIPEKDPDYPDRILFTPPNKEDMSLYDTSAIRAAWESGDPAGLSGSDRAVYDAAQTILKEIIQEGMTDLEKETAVYRWVVDNVNYDWTHQDVMAETPRTAYQPYGGLVDRAAVCLGYAASFQLLMDLAGVECVTVVGACYDSEDDHAWNMVRLQDEWYCVDVTWDANGREQLGDGFEWRYFNVTSDKLAENHQWDYANTPEATAENQGQG